MSETKEDTQGPNRPAEGGGPITESPPASAGPQAPLCTLSLGACRALPTLCARLLGTRVKPRLFPISSQVSPSRAPPPESAERDSEPPGFIKVLGKYTAGKESCWARGDCNRRAAARPSCSAGRGSGRGRRSSGALTTVGNALSDPVRGKHRPWCS